MGPTLQATGHSAVREDASGSKSRPLDPGSLPSEVGLGPRQVPVTYLQVSNPMLRATSIWAMVGSVLLKALQRSAASVLEML